jgi:hypothetical protein
MCEIDGDLCAELLLEFGIVEKERGLLARDECECTGVISKMVVFNDFLLCKSCGMVKTLHEDVGALAKGPSTYQVGSRTYSCYGNGVRDRSDKVADLVTHYKTTISNRDRCIDAELLGVTCNLMYDITSKHIKKKDNRLSLFATMLYLVSIKMDRILAQNEIKQILGKGFKFSKGYKIISNSVLNGEIEAERIGIGMKIYSQLISKYLSVYDPKFYLNDGNSGDRNINNNRNRKFCITIVEVMLDRNIAYNATIQSKCIAVVYYLIKNNSEYRYEDETAQRKYFTSIVNVGENTFLKVYNTLISRDTQRIFRSSDKFM